MSDVQSLIEDCNTILERLHQVDRKTVWYHPPHGLGHQVARWLEGLAESALRIDAPDAPPDPPSLADLFVCGMQADRGIALAESYVRRLRSWASGLGRGSETGLRDNPFAKKNVNARMLEKLQQDEKSGTRECYGWTCPQWAKHLQCSPPSVVATETWKMLESARGKQKAEKAMDRYRRSKPRKRE